MRPDHRSPIFTFWKASHVCRSIPAAFTSEKWAPVIAALEGMTDDQIGKIDAGFLASEAEEDESEDTEPEKVRDEARKAFKKVKAVATAIKDIALFGRMVAEVKKGAMTVTAASQVAHAISTNKVEMEFDFFTAVDDLQQTGETVARLAEVLTVSIMVKCDTTRWTASPPSMSKR
jgi:hypothetical protein